MAIMDLFTSLQTIINERSAKKVRQSIHDGIFRANQVVDANKNLVDQVTIRQDAVEQYNNQMITEMTDKDVISAPEIIQARGGKATLGQRLDETTAQLEQTTMDVIAGVIQPNIGEYITTNGFYGFGNTYRYAVLPIDGNENFSDSGKGFEITTQGEIKISDNAKILPVPSDRVSVGALGCNNDNDDVCFQAALDLAKARDCNIEVDVDVNIARFIDVYRGGSHEERRIIEISGRGIMSKNNQGYMFTNSLSRSGGNIKFNGVHFRSVEGAGTYIYHGGFLLRMYFENCHFIDVDHLTKARETAPHDYMQTVYFSGGTVVGGKGWFIDAYTAYDVSFTHSLVEHRESFAKIDLSHGVRITDNVIEGMTGRVFEGVGGRSLVVSDNYFEENETESNGAYIKINNGAQRNDGYDWENITIENNSIITSSLQRDDSDYYVVEVNNLLKAYKIGDNFSDANFLKVNHQYSASSNIEGLVNLLSQNIQLGRKAVNNSQAPYGVSRGSGNMLKPLDSSYLSVPTGVTKNVVTGKVATLNSNGTATEFYLREDDNKRLYTINSYVIGVSLSLSGDFSTISGAELMITTPENVKVWSTDINIQENPNFRNTFYTSEPFVPTVDGDYRVSLKLKSTGATFSSDFTLYVDNFVLQKGTVATNTLGL